MGVLEQIATEANVSPNTVLRVLRGENKEVWPSAVERATQIRQIAQRLGYLPNSSARAMRRGRFNTIALVLSTDRGRSYLPDELFSGIHDALNERGLRLIVSKLPDEDLTDSAKLPAILREWACDGLLINYTDRVPPQMVNLMEQYHVPAVWINRKQNSDAVYYNDFAGAYRATEHLLKLGHRDICYIDFCPQEEWADTHYSHADRYNGYAAAMRETGIEPVARKLFAGIAVTHRLEASVDLLRSARRPTAIIAYDCGVRLLMAATMAGLSVPEDLSLMTFGSSANAAPEQSNQQYIGRTMGVIGVPVEEAGTAAVHMLMKKMDDKSDSLASQVLSLELCPGDTCGPALR